MTYKITVVYEYTGDTEQFRVVTMPKYLTYGTCGQIELKTTDGMIIRIRESAVRRLTIIEVSY